MADTLHKRPAQSAGMNDDINMIANALAHDDASRQDLRQEMKCRLLTLPQGRARRFYLHSLRNAALRHWGRKMIDAPLDRAGRPILERRTRAVGGLVELDCIHRRQSAA